MPTRAEMVQVQLRDRGIGDERVLAAMAALPRELFVEPALAGSAYDDRALPIGHGQTLSQPWVVAAICQALELTGEERVFEVGSGSGYSAAILAALCREVISIELVDELGSAAAARLHELGVSNVRVRIGDGGHDLAGERFDAIAVHAAAPGVPPSLARGLRPGGRLVIPIATGDGGETLRVYRHTGANSEGCARLTATDISPVRFVPLRGEAGFEDR